MSRRRPARLAPPPNWRWHVVVRLDVDGAPQGYRAIGPISWTHARELAEAWEKIFGVGTALVAERLGARTRRVAVG